MKHSSYPIYFMSIILLALVMLTSGCPQPVNIDAKTILLPGDIPLELLWIPPGSFMMGSPEDEQNSFDNEGPQHEVTITEGFWMSKFPITQAQWEAIMGDNPSQFQGENRPVEQVMWDDIRGTDGYLETLNAIYQGYNFRLPSEAEWEYAYRAGTMTRFYWGDDPDNTDIDDYAWYWGNSAIGNLRQTHPVGQKMPNAWGLHDMAGNVWEWCEDDWHSSYNDAPSDGSAWVDTPRGSWRMLRGGSCTTFPQGCRAAFRYNLNPDYFDFNIGFRVVCTMD
jgi:formylglycine-generating enzyme required for sulfatase activity